MILEQASRKGSARTLYAAQIDSMGERLDILEARLEATRHEQSNLDKQSTARKAKIKSLKEQTVDAIMQLIATDPSQFNQILSTLIKRLTYNAHADPDLVIDVWLVSCVS